MDKDLVSGIVGRLIYFGVGFMTCFLLFVKGIL